VSFTPTISILRKSKIANSDFRKFCHERTTTAKNMGILKYHPTSLISYEIGMPGRSYQTKPGNYRNINSLTLVQKVISGYLQRTVDNYSRAYLWLISHDLSHGVPLMQCFLHKPLVVHIVNCRFFIHTEHYFTGSVHLKGQTNP
jgi:hypothetical protein